MIFIIGCSGVAGTYEHGGIIIGANKYQLQGEFVKENRSDFTGTITNDCKGIIKFHDENPKSFQYDEEQYKIFLGDRETGEVWDKGKNFSKYKCVFRKKIIFIL